MKKALLSIIIISCTCLCANATYSVRYNSAGSPVNAPNNFGSNASFTPANRAKAGYRNRQIKYEKQFYNGLENRNNVNININSSNKTNAEDNSPEVSTTKRTFVKGKFKKTRKEAEQERIKSEQEN